MKALGDGVVRDDMSLRLPGNTSHGPVVPRESRDPGAVVRSTTEDWEARAAAADRAAELLQEAMLILRGPNEYQKFGDCVEGVELATRVGQAIQTWRNSLSQRRLQAIDLTTRCRIAGAKLDQADANGANEILT